MNNTTEPQQQRILEDLDFIWSRTPVPPIIVMYGLMLSLATLIVYLSSISTVQQPTNAADPDQKSELYHPADLEKSMVEERMDTNEAYLMPVTAGAALLSLYYAFKYLDVDLVQLVLKYYFVIASVFAVASASSLTVKGFLRIVLNKTVPHYILTLARDWTYGTEMQQTIEKENQLGGITFDATDALAFPLSGALNYLQWHEPHWVVGNLIGGSLAIMGIRSIRLSSFKVGMIMLAGLFFYDIYFVFGTDVMMTVATKVQGPIKLEIPRPPREDVEQHRAMAMLGLGDIVVPAMFVSLCLRFDVWRFYEQQAAKLPFHLKRPISTPYFRTALLAYVVGLVGTILVMHVFKAGQPALLYLCPSIAFATLLTAWARGELKMLWGYTESVQDEEDEKDKKEKDDKRETQGKTEAKKTK